MSTQSGTATSKAASPEPAEPSTRAAIAPGQFFETWFDDSATIDASLWGFGGLHGGLALAAANNTMTQLVHQESADAPQLRTISAQFLRPVRSNVETTASIIRPGRASTVATATLASRGKPALLSTATFGRPSTQTAEYSPQMPTVPGPADCSVYELPAELVPFAQHIEIRPATPNLPFTGSTLPELTAWIRLRDDDTPIDTNRLIMLVDALAPSFTATLTAPAILPTIELVVRPTAGLKSTSSPWVLIAAKTVSSGPDGWVTEHINAWSPDGSHLGTAEQVRLMLG